MWIDTFGGIAFRSAARPAISRRGPLSKRDRRDLLDARERDEDQRDQQHHAEPEREGRAGHEIMPFQNANTIANQAPTALAAIASVTASRAVAAVFARIGSDNSKPEQRRRGRRPSSNRDR